MKEAIEKKLAELKAEFDNRNKSLVQKQQEVSQITTVLVQIQGAVSVLEELLKA